VALAECAIAGGLGATVELPDPGLDPFGEDLGTAFIVAGAREDLAGLPIIGEVGGDTVAIDGLLSVPVFDLAETHARGLGALVS
jgi:phosphoribosylformylglycinamidine synthase subunit PurL